MAVRFRRQRSRRQVKATAAVRPLSADRQHFCPEVELLEPRLAPATFDLVSGALTYTGASVVKRTQAR